MRLLVPAAPVLLIAALTLPFPALAQEPPPAAAPPAAGPVAPDPPPPAAVDPATGLRASERIARRYGPERRRLKFVIATDGVPDGVDSERFVAMAETQGARWGLRPDGVTLDPVSLRNGRTEVGFSARVPDGVLGVHIMRVHVRFRRLMRCRVAPNGRRSGCVTVGVRKVDTTVTDRDILLSTQVPWEPGPVWPEADEFDLQTVVIHEFGHLAGNGRHDPRCTVAPMTPSLSPGDWWRSTLDHRVVCRSGARAAAARPAAMRFGHREVVVRSIETRVLPTASQAPARALGRTAAR